IVDVSPDRAFIDRLATRVLALRVGRAVSMEGNYTETADARAERRRRPERAPAAGAPAGPDGGRSTADGRQAEAAVAPPKPSRPPRRAETAEDKEAARRRRRIKTLEEKITALENEIEGLESRLWDEALTLGPVAAHELSKQKTAKRAELDALVEEWARLSEEAESAAPRSP
ncbi:MAG: hypothetical protein ACM3NW_11650, partial [Syntrophomonadaceae bacterium]